MPLHVCVSESHDTEWTCPLPAGQRTCGPTCPREQLPQASSPETAHRVRTDTKAMVGSRGSETPYEGKAIAPKDCFIVTFTAAFVLGAGECYLGQFPPLRRGGHKRSLPLQPLTGGFQILCAKSPAPGFSGSGSYGVHGFYQNLGARVKLASRSHAPARSRVVPREGVFL